MDDHTWTGLLPKKETANSASGSSAGAHLASRVANANELGHGLRVEILVGGLPYMGPFAHAQRHGCQKRARVCGLGSKGWRILPPGRAKDLGAIEGVGVQEVVVPTVGLPAKAAKAGAPHGTLRSAIVPAAHENRLPVGR